MAKAFLTRCVGPETGLGGLNTVRIVAVVADHQNAAYNAVRAAVPGSSEHQVIGDLSDETVRDLGLLPGQVRILGTLHSN
jgi:hypothetical protein